MGSIGEESNDFEVIVVGGGFCGTWLLYHLREAGFKVRLFEHGSALGGIWYWNNYPGARVDTPVPTYQLTSTETWDTWEWKQMFPGRDELVDYFRHLERIWDLKKDITYDSKITSLHWDPNTSKWRYEINEGERSGTAWSVVTCTGFASKSWYNPNCSFEAQFTNIMSEYIPPWPGVDSFKGQKLHTSTWPQSGFNLDNKRVAVIGTGATGVQTIQEVAKKASHLTVFQRTPNTALPMSVKFLRNPNQNAATNKAMRDAFPETRKKMKETYAGFDYEFLRTKPETVPKEERMAFYDRLYNAGGLQLWLGAYEDCLQVDQYNDEVYDFWRAKTLPRIKDKKNQELLAPEKKAHPFGTKRISLESDYFECFNRDNVDLISIKENNISEFTPKGIKTEDGTEHEFDVIVFATGFDTHTGGLTQIDLVGENGQTMEQKWKDGVHTYLGITAAGFPNLVSRIRLFYGTKPSNLAVLLLGKLQVFGILGSFFCYGPQAPTAFATGPSHAENQGTFIVDTLKYMRDNKYKSIEPTHEAEKEFKELVNYMGYQGLFSKADSWYFGANIPGKAREPLNFMGGMPMYRKKLVESQENDYKGFVLAH